MSRKKIQQVTKQPDTGSLLNALLVVFVMISFNAMIFQEIFSSYLSAGIFFSPSTWIKFVELCGGTVSETPQHFQQAELSYISAWFLLAVISTIFLLLGAFGISRKKSIPFQRAFIEWGIRGWRWWGVLILWQFTSFLFLVLEWIPLSEFQLASLPLWIAFQGAGWFTEYLTLIGLSPAGITENPLSNTAEPKKKGIFTRSVLLLISSCAIYVVIFTWMNWGLYWELLLPHGDSAMYEEHLWNLTHGKGFRSYLDQGLFLGEHIQFIHLFLISFHWIYPSQLTMELFESIALASGAIPVYFLARRHSGSESAGLWLACGYLFYFPLQFLDIAIDFKTFRPIGFGVPVLLFALDQLERKRYKTMILLFLVALTAKEDYAIVLAPIGLWIAFFQSKVDQNLQKKRGFLFGLSIAILSTAYLLVTVAIILPWFRSGVEVHYVGYFSQFGGSLGEVIRNILDPRKLVPALFTVKSLLYVFMILVPLGFLPLFSSSRFATCLPLLSLLCLNEIAQDPRHHFHAPLIPILFWSACAGIAPMTECLNKFKKRMDKKSDSTVLKNQSQNRPAIFLCLNSLMAGLFLSISPAGISFWDSGHSFYWKKLYVPGQRAEMFSRIEDMIPIESRVASTDFVHPRFTHHERAYDYSNYSRAVNKNQTGAPPDTDYIVIDTTHRYSEIKKPMDIPEYRDHPEDWELLPDKTEGYFIILKRRSR
jgi:uncharacterized membrane protein